MAESVGKLPVEVVMWKRPIASPKNEKPIDDHATRVWRRVSDRCFGGWRGWVLFLAGGVFATVATEGVRWGVGMVMRRQATLVGWNEVIWVAAAIIYAGAVVMFYWRPAISRGVREEKGEVCLECGYELRGLPDGVARCPECGQERTIGLG